MALNFKKERLEMMKDIYEGRGVIDDLKKKFSDDKYKEIKSFLHVKKFIKMKDGKLFKHSNRSGVIIGKSPISWKLTSDGVEYYESEVEKQERANPAINIHANNSAVSVNSPESKQVNGITGSIGLLDVGKNNSYHTVGTEGFDNGMVMTGEGAVVYNSVHVGKDNKSTAWYEKWLAKGFLWLIGTLAGGFLLLKIGWN